MRPRCQGGGGGAGHVGVQMRESNRAGVSDEDKGKRVRGGGQKEERRWKRGRKTNPRHNMKGG